LIPSTRAPVLPRLQPCGRDDSLIVHHPNAPHRRQYLLQYFELLCFELGLDHADPCDVAARLGQARAQSLGYEVASDGDDWDRTGRTLRGMGSRFTKNDNDACLFLNEHLRHLGKSLGIAIGEAEVEEQVVALDMP
jgi:hypothetical protein